MYNNSTSVINTNEANNVFLLTGPPQTCAGWIQVDGLVTVNQSLTGTPALVVFGAANVYAGDQLANMVIPVYKLHLEYIATDQGTFLCIGILLGECLCVSGYSSWSADNRGALQ